MFFVAVLCQKRLKKVRRASRRLQEQLELEMKRRSQLEEVLRTTGASSEALRILTGEWRAELSDVPCRVESRTVQSI